MAAPAIPPIRPGPIATGLAAGKLRGPADRYVVTAFTDSSAERGAVRAAGSTIDAPSDLALDLVLTGGAIGNHTASHPTSHPKPHPEIPVRPEPGATTPTTVFRGIDDDFADAVPFGVRPAVPALFDGLPGHRISSSASFAA
jgi:hypothetical protein